MHIVQVLAPIILLLATGAALARLRFVDQSLVSGLNRLTFRIALPALIFHSAAVAGRPVPSTGGIVITVTAATLVMVLISWLVASALALPKPTRKTFIAASLVGNLAYIGIPIVDHSLRGISDGRALEMLSSSVLTMTIMAVTNNAIAVVVLESRTLKFVPLARELILHPVVLSGSLGLLCSVAGVKLPIFLDRFLLTLGAMAIPAALLCIGATLQATSLRGRLSTMAAATACKVALYPLCVWLIARFLNLDPVDTRVALIFAACPTAAIIYTMATQMDGDAELAAGTTALSTVVAFASLAVALAIT